LTKCGEKFNNVGIGDKQMANRPKTERNQKILAYWEKGYRQKSIARMFKMKESAVGMVILRERKKRDDNDSQ